MSEPAERSRAAGRFRGYLPVIVDVETGGFDPRTDALLEVAAVIVAPGAGGRWSLVATPATHVAPFPGARVERAALEVNGIDPDNPLRGALPGREALQRIFAPVRRAVREHGCTRAIMVGHNPSFDLAFVNAAAARTGMKRNPFHPFSSFDTATLGGLAYGQTVLSRAVQAAGLEWDSRQAHSAIYDAEQTARLFCAVVNLWGEPRGPGRGNAA